LDGPISAKYVKCGEARLPCGSIAGHSFERGGQTFRFFPSTPSFTSLTHATISGACRCGRDLHRHVHLSRRVGLKCVNCYSRRVSEKAHTRPLDPYLAAPNSGRSLWMAPALQG
jgi:hypothetical protein